MKCNDVITRLAFWTALHNQLLEFEPLLKAPHALTIQDRVVLNEMHKLIFEAFTKVKESIKRNNNALTAWINGRS